MCNTCRLTLKVYVHVHIPLFRPLSDWGSHMYTTVACMSSNQIKTTAILQICRENFLVCLLRIFRGFHDSNILTRFFLVLAKSRKNSDFAYFATDCQKCLFTESHVMSRSLQLKLIFIYIVARG